MTKKYYYIVEDEAWPVYNLCYAEDWNQEQWKKWFIKQYSSQDEFLKKCGLTQEKIDWVNEVVERYEEVQDFLGGLFKKFYKED